MSLTRRSFLRSAGSGLLVAAAAPVLAELEPVRRWWQVSRKAPVGDPNIMLRLIMGGDYEPLYRGANPLEHGYTYTPSSPLTFEMHGTVGPGETSAAWTRIRGGSSRYDRATAKHAERVAIAEEMHNRGMLTDEQTIKALDQAGADWDRESGVKYPREGMAYEDAWDSVQGELDQVVDDISRNLREFERTKLFALREIKTRAELLAMYPDPEART